jgi:hypothetical protein
VLVAGSAGLLAVVLAGCAGSGASGSGAAQVANLSADRLSADPLTAVRGAADITGHSGSLQDATLLRTVSASKRATLRGTAGYDYAAQAGELTVTVPPGTQASAGKLTEVFTPGVVYMQGRSSKVPAGKWVKVDVRELADGNLVSSGATDPATAAAALRGAQTAVKAGTGTVDGVSTTRYTGTLDLAQAAQATGGPGAYGLSLAARTFSVKKVPYQVWLDGHGRIIKLVEVFTFSSVPGSSKAADQVTVTSQSDFSRFGTPVKVAVPSGSQVYQGK